MKDFKEFKNESLGVSFKLPKKITVRTRLSYRRALMTQSVEASVYERLYVLAATILKDWSCETIPDPLAFNLAESTDEAAANVVVYVSDCLAEHMGPLETVPKN